MGVSSLVLLFLLSCGAVSPFKISQRQSLRELSVSQCEHISNSWKRKDLYTHVIHNSLDIYHRRPKDLYFGWFEKKTEPNCVLWIEYVSSYEVKVKRIWYPQFSKANIEKCIVKLAHYSGCIVDFSCLKTLEIDKWTLMVNKVDKIKKKILLGNNTDVFTL